MSGIGLAITAGKIINKACTIDAGTKAVKGILKAGEVVKSISELAKETSGLKDNIKLMLPTIETKLDEKEMGFDVADKPIISEIRQEEKLNESEKSKIKAETKWSDQTVDNIGNMEEYEIYKNAGLKEIEINGNICLVKGDISLNIKDDFGNTNKEPMESGNAPITEDGQTIELHHIGEEKGGVLVELSSEEYKNNDVILQDKESEKDQNLFCKIKNSYCKGKE